MIEEKVKKSRIYLLGMVILYLLVFIFFQVSIQFKLVSLLPDTYVSQAKITVILATFMKSSLTIFALIVLFFINRIILKFAEARIDNFHLINAFISIIFVAIIVEFCRFILAKNILIPFAEGFDIGTVNDYSLLLYERIPNSAWSKWQNILDFSFAIFAPTVYGSYLGIVLKEKWLDIILSSLIIIGGLMSLQLLT